MNDLLRDTLDERARAVDVPELDVAALVRSGERRLRRRRNGVVAAVALAVAMVVSAPTLVAGFRDDPRPVDRPGPIGPTPSPDPDARPNRRPLVWAEGSTLHVGERHLDIGFTPPFWNGDDTGWSRDSLAVLRATDDGAVFATLDGRIFFSDGGTIVRAGSVSSPRITRRSVSYPSGGPDSWIWTDSVGSRAFWVVEAPETGRLEIVVYDTAARDVTDRVHLAVPPGRGFGDWEVYGDHVYWRHSPLNGSVLRNRLVRTTLSTGASVPADDAMVKADRASFSPALLVGNRRVTERDAQTFVVEDGVLQALHPDGDPDVDRRLLPAFDPSSGDLLRFRAPAGVQQVRDLVLFGWQDTDRFALSTTPTHLTQRRDIVVCRISTEACKIVVRKGPGPWLLIPYAGMPG